MPPCALTIAGSDSSGGAGIQADLKVFATLRVHGFSVVTAVTAQRADKVLEVAPVSGAIVRSQMTAAFDEGEIGAIKIGMLANEEILKCVAGELKQRSIPIVVDPVLVASDGTPLFDRESLETFKRELLPLASVVTPNIAEAALLSGERVESLDDAKHAAKKIFSLYGERSRTIGPPCALVKGGHLQEKPTDVLFDGNEMIELEGDRVEGPRVHGTGCLFSASLAALLAKGWEVRPAARQAKRLTRQWIEQAVALRSGIRVAMM